MTQNEIAPIARRFVNIPFQLHGRNKYGIDCVGLLYCTAWDMGLDIPDFKNYSMIPSEEVLVPNLLERGFTSLNKIHEGSVVALSVGNAGYSNHAGIVVGNNLIHVMNGKKCVEHRFSEFMKSKVKSILGFPTIEYKD